MDSLIFFLFYKPYYALSTGRQRPKQVERPSRATGSVSCIIHWCRMVVSTVAGSVNAS